MRLESYLRTKVSTPRAFNENHLMPKYRFAPDEVEAIVVALMSFSENPVPEATPEDALALTAYLTTLRGETGE
jgi:hypothetical protein